MNQRFLRFAAYSAAAAMFLYCLMNFPEFAAFWVECISRPLLRTFNAIGTRIPFSALEWGAVFLVLFWIASWARDIFQSGLLRSFRKLFLRMIRSFLLILLSFLIMWLPLYYTEEEYAFQPSTAQILSSCRVLIDELNAASADFTAPPDDLPAKFTASANWMQRANISGFYSFITGEALVSPDLPGCILPFVAVHETMHASGIAGEGNANIAAWQECMQRGGKYAVSARIWALKYSLAMLRNRDPKAWRMCRGLMSAQTQTWIDAAGSNVHASPIAQTVSDILGIGSSMQDYEMLALYLAANMPE